MAAGDRRVYRNIKKIYFIIHSFNSDDKKIFVVTIVRTPNIRSLLELWDILTAVCVHRYLYCILRNKLS